MLAPVLFGSFAVLVILILMNIFLAIINDAFVVVSEKQKQARSLTGIFRSLFYKKVLRKQFDSMMDDLTQQSTFSSAAELMEKMDINGDAYLDPGELEELLRQTKLYEHFTVKELIARFDSDGDGKLSGDEVQKMNEALLRKRRQVDMQLAAQLSDGLDWGFFSYFLFQAKNSFKAVYRTRGHDIQHLMSGMTQLFLLFKRMSFILTVIIGKNCLVALVRIPFVQALINDASASGARDNDASASNSNAPMPRRQAVALLCAEAIVLTALGMYGVRKDEEAQGRAAQSDVVGDTGEQNGESNNEKTEIDAGAGGEQKKSN